MLTSFQISDSGKEEDEEADGRPLVVIEEDGMGPGISEEQSSSMVSSRSRDSNQGHMNEEERGSDCL